MNTDGKGIYKEGRKRGKQDAKPQIGGGANWQMIPDWNSKIITM